MSAMMENLSNQEMGMEEVEVIELGNVSEQTKGGYTGSTWDGGGGRQKP